MGGEGGPSPAPASGAEPRGGNLADPRLAWYRGVADPELLRAGGRFVAEGRSVVARLLADPRWAVESVLVTPPALAWLRTAVGRRLDGVPVFVVSLEELRGLAGYNIHRGCLAIGLRPAPLPIETVLSSAGERAVALGLEGLADPDNVGACFRNAAAFGACAIVADRRCADPFYRKAIRTSMAAVFQVPFTRIPAWPDRLAWLRKMGWTSVALVAGQGASELNEVAPALRRSGRVLLLVGAEGAGLEAATVAEADVVVRIPMAPGVDSLNVATAAAIALYAVACPGR